MCDLSEQEVNALRAWLRVTRALYSTDGLPPTVRPLSMMLLVHVWLKPDQSASYAELRATFELRDQSKLSHAIKPLIKRELVKRVRMEPRKGAQVAAAGTGPRCNCATSEKCEGE